MTWSFTRMSAVASGMSAARRIVAALTAQWLARPSALQRSGKEYYARRKQTRRLGYDPGPDEGWPRIGYAKGQTEV